MLSYFKTMAVETLKEMYYKVFTKGAKLEKFLLIFFSRRCRQSVGKLSLRK